MTVDLFYEDGRPGAGREGLAVEMEAATLFTVGAAAGVPVACVLAVSDTFGGGRHRRIDDDSLRAAAETMGAAAIAALS